MHKKLLILLLISAVSFQSIATVADVHELFKSEVSQTDTDLADVVENAPDDGVLLLIEDSFDCQNCCQCFDCQSCQNCHVSSLLPSVENFSFLYASQSLSNTSQTIHGSYNFKLLRPPEV